MRMREEEAYGRAGGRDWGSLPRTRRGLSRLGHSRAVGRRLLLVPRGTEDAEPS